MSVNLNGGDLSGDGTVAANVNNINNIAGRVNPGGVGTAGTINIVAVPFGPSVSYTQGASGILNIDIGGTASNQFDQLNVSGTATLDGTLNVGLINSFLPDVGNSFKIMTFSSRSPADSDFATYIGLNLPNGLVFTPVYHDNLTPADLTLTILNQASPTINTTQLPASATVGTSIADKATVSGGDSPTGTVTFVLYNNPNGSGTPLFSDTETLSSGMATSKGYIAAATGTDYWVATYNGDSNNAAVSSGTALEPVTVTGAPHVGVTKTADSATIVAGQTAGFVVTISNTGTATATGVSFSDPLPAGAGTDIVWSISTQDAANDFSISGTTAGSQSLVFSPTTLAAGESHTVTLTGTVSAADAPTSFTGTLVNTATVTAGNETAAEQNQSSTATINITAPDVDISKTTSTPTVNAGGTAGFTVTIANNGTGAANGLTLNDSLPAAGNDINWMIDTTEGNPTDFTITGAEGSQSLACPRPSSRRAIAWPPVRPSSSTSPVRPTPATPTSARPRVASTTPAPPQPA